jgi:hypothetical protein
MSTPYELIVWCSVFCESHKTHVEGIYHCDQEVGTTPGCETCKLYHAISCAEAKLQDRARSGWYSSQTYVDIARDKAIKEAYEKIQRVVDDRRRKAQQEADGKVRTGGWTRSSLLRPGRHHPEAASETSIGSSGASSGKTP